MSGRDGNPPLADRHASQVVQVDVGPAGRERLDEARVLIVGAGGLGAPVIQYLAAAGVGTLVVVDDDVVERSNLQRQVIHGVDDLGRPKVDSAAEAVAALDPGVEVVARHERVTADTVEDQVAAADVVIDAADDLPTRYLLNDACALAGRPCSHGAVIGFEGQVATFAGGADSPCYRCLFPEAPAPETVPDCATAGVLGVLPGLVGCLQTTEAIKSILGAGSLLDGRLLSVDGLGTRFDEVAIRADPACPVCGEDPAIESVRDVTYEDSCAIAAE